ncbi:hypothetical protein HanXRQr2_Chr06g0241371 [Helianthus annuus]|uniref:Uncharacterized protein n=1 Tax=Helianthus annuus TaxID=4232 RepID=A0A9K3IQ29_HELAN|nr:hypothetical protein HanXRQr2_Chr06g0241371 [Helianthus annuus]KAJ0913934.1 hypothetical protein HanPSC8_Chr06g0232931 [Helianthus annuus]
MHCCGVRMTTPMQGSPGGDATSVPSLELCDSGVRTGIQVNGGGCGSKIKTYCIGLCFCCG